MRRFFLTIIALFFPWLSFLLMDNPGAAILAIVMQATLIGWPFATMWALRDINQSEIARLREKFEEERRDKK